MKRRGFGYAVPAATAVPKKMNLAQRLEAERLQRLAQAARIDIPSSPIPNNDAPLPLTERDNRPLEQRMGLDTGADRDAELDRRKQATIADPNSPESRASKDYAERVANELGWDETAQHIYGLAVRSVEISKQRPMSIAIPTPGESDGLRPFGAARRLCLVLPWQLESVARVRFAAARLATDGDAKLLAPNTSTVANADANTMAGSNAPLE
jgi:hypothetical protein